MLARIKGTVLNTENSKAIVDVSGLGLEVQLTRKAFSLCSVGCEIVLFCHVQFSDAGPSLFGFADELEKAVFIRLISVKGIGGKMALLILQGMSGEEVVQAISLGDHLSLTKVPGIGKKTAERICFELQEKMSLNLPSIGDFSHVNSMPDSSAVLEALESLGFSRLNASDALSEVLKTRGSIDGVGIEDLIMLTLRYLNRRS